MFPQCPLQDVCQCVRRQKVTISHKRPSNIFINQSYCAIYLGNNIFKIVVFEKQYQHIYSKFLLLLTTLHKKHYLSF